MRLYVGTFLALAVMAWAALLWLRGIPLQQEHFWPYGLVVSTLVAVTTLFERWGWASPALRGWFVKRPDLRGSWRVELQSDFVGPTTGQRPGPITCYMVVRQSLATLSMRLLTMESTSRLVSHAIVQEEDGGFLVTGVYINTPTLRLRGRRSEIHYGALLLRAEDNPPLFLNGHYWTDRNSRGEMHLSRRMTRVFSSYEDAQSAYGDC